MRLESRRVRSNRVGRVRMGEMVTDILRELNQPLVAIAAVTALQQYLATWNPGLWRDQLDGEGMILAGPAPAIDCYHIVSAIRTFTTALQRGSLR